MTCLVEGIRIKRYSRDGVYIDAIDTKSNITGTYAIDDEENYYLFSGVSNSQPILTINDNGQAVNKFGLLYEVAGNEWQKLWFQRRNLFITQDNHLLSVGISYPSVEMYDLNGDLIFAQLFDEPLIIKSYEASLATLKKEPDTMSNLYNDVYVYNNHLYMLKSEQIGQKLVNHLLIWDYSKGQLDFTDRYQLTFKEDVNYIFDKMCLLNDSTLLISEMLSNNLCFFQLN
jgi:hypothetical protein